MPNFNYSGPRITPDTSRIDQASQQSFQLMANVEIDRYKRRQEMIARAMDFINIEVPETMLQDQKALADKYSTFKQEAINVYKNASDQNRELNFDESALLAKQKSALLKEAQAVNMYYQLNTHAMNAYMADPDKYEEQFIEDISQVDFKKPVEERTNPMTILAANIYYPGFDLKGFEEKVGTADQFYKTDDKGRITLDEAELRRNVSKVLENDPREVRRGARKGLWTDFDGSVDYLYNYIADKFTSKIPRPRVGRTSGGRTTAIPLDFVQPQTFTYGQRDYGFATAVDLQKAGPTIVNGKTIQPVSVGFLPEAKEKMEFTVPRPKGWSDPLGVFPWSKQKITVEAGSPIPEEFVNQVDASKYDYKPYVTFKGKHKDADGNEVFDEDLSVAPYDEKVRTAFANGTNTKDAHNYITGLENNPAALQNITGKVGQKAESAKPEQKSEPVPEKQTTGQLSPVGLTPADATAILGDANVKALKDNGYITEQDGVLVLNFDTQEQYDQFIKTAKAKGYSMK